MTMTAKLNDTTMIPKAVKSWLDSHGNKLRILVEHQKHGDVYWNATGDKLFSASLTILAQRKMVGYILSRDEAVNRLNSAKVNADLNFLNLSSLPASLIQYAEQKYAEQQTEINICQNDFSFAHETEIALEREDGVLAFLILNDRKSYEYEGFELVLPI